MREYRCNNREMIYTPWIRINRYLEVGITVYGIIVRYWATTYNDVHQFNDGKKKQENSYK